MNPIAKYMAGLTASYLLNPVFGAMFRKSIRFFKIFFERLGVFVSLYSATTCALCFGQIFVCRGRKNEFLRVREPNLVLGYLRGSLNN